MSKLKIIQLLSFCPVECVSRFSFSRCSNHKSRSNLDNCSNSTNFELASTAFETETNWTQADGLSTVQQAEAASSLAWPFALVYASVEIAFLSFLLL